MNSFSKIVCRIQDRCIKSFVLTFYLLHIMSEESKNELESTQSFTIMTTKRSKHLKINLSEETQDPHTENYRMKEIKTLIKGEDV